jgi:hypothetical protein
LGLGLVIGALEGRLAPSQFDSADAGSRLKGCILIQAEVFLFRFETPKYGKMGAMKTTIEIPDPLFRQVKSAAAQRGQSLKDFVTEALGEKLAPRSRAFPTQPQWMAGFGKLHRLRKETAKVLARIEQQFDVIEPEDRL